ncbi:hypothetical protein ACJX0J_036251 [Zea mays]
MYVQPTSLLWSKGVRTWDDSKNKEHFLKRTITKVHAYIFLKGLVPLPFKNRYFQMIANGKHRKKLIRSLDHEGGKIEGQTNLKNYITEFYKGLFGDPLDNNISLDEEIIQDITQGDIMLMFNDLGQCHTTAYDKGEVAEEHEQIGGIVPHLIEGGLSILQYADDTILFLEHDLDKARNMKLEENRREPTNMGHLVPT